MSFGLLSVGLVALSIFDSLQGVKCSPHATRQTSAPEPAVSVSLDGVTYVNKGLVAFGLIPSDAIDSLGDTLGGFGSAMAFKLGTWKPLGNGSYTGSLETHPDRGFNVISTIDYRARQHQIDFLLTPYTGSDNLSFVAAQQTLQLTYIDTVVQFDRDGGNTSGLDALGVRPAETPFLIDPLTAPEADPEIPIANETYQHLTIDCEGLVANADGSYWISDEYGPYIYHYLANGTLVQTIQPPIAFLPFDASGNLNFTEAVDPTTGRGGNKGFEGLTLDPANNILYAMLQEALIQDGGSVKTTARYTRMVAYDVSDPTVVRPPLVGEWVVPLPVSASKNTTRASSEIHFVSENIFFSLSRDGNGNGDGNTTADTLSKYKQADLFSIAGATNIADSEFDDPANPVAPGGVLLDEITPATYVSFINYIDPIQIARFGLTNGGFEVPTLVNEKWESLALAPVDDPAFPNDYFLFTASDNDFLTENGTILGAPYNAGVNVDNQFFVFQLTLPTVSLAGLQQALGV